jgi:eukaryotic-like serine/threonine-protein kinase
MEEDLTGEFRDPAHAPPRPPAKAGAAKADSRIRDLRGTVIDHYKIIALLGEGGFGSVYLAEQTEPVQRRVALKLIKPGMDSRSVVARFEAERQVLALLDHPSIAKVFDAGLTPEGRPYFAMELVRGMPIAQYCELERISVADRVRLMIQVCGAVQHAHMKGVLHRDLKPSNILVTSDDDKPLAKIIDFGVAKALHHRVTPHTIYTEMGQMIGTPDYMAPEQARGAPDVDTRADIYALGAILYELLTGLTPLDITSRFAQGQSVIERAIEEEQPTPPSVRLRKLAESERPSSMRGSDAPNTFRQVRGDLDWIVLKCLEKERARRYQSAAALADDLERYLNDEPVLAGRPSAMYRAAKFARRHRAAVSAAAVVVLTIVLGIVGMSYALNRAMQEAAAAAQARDESEAVTSFLTQMIQSVSPDEAGRDVTVREVLDRSSADLELAFADRPIVEARLRHAIGVSYWQLGRLAEAERHLAAAVDRRTAELGADHVDTLRSQANLGGLRLQQGRLAEAQQILEGALEGFERVVGRDHALTLGVANNLGVIYARLDREEEALEMSRWVYDGQRRALGPDHPHTLGALTNLASQLADMGRIDEAEPLMRQAVAGWERAHGPDRPGTLNAIHALAMMQRSAGRMLEAEESMIAVVELRRRVFGEGHIETCSALANLGLIQRDMDRPEEAGDSLFAAWTCLRVSIGDAHPTTIRVLGFLADVLEQEGWPARSESFVADIVDSLRAVAGRDDVAANELNTIASILLMIPPAESRDTNLALAVASRACEKERHDGGSNLWMFLDTLASAQHACGQSEQALANQREALRLLPPTAARYLGEMEERALEYELALRRGE